MRVSLATLNAVFANHPNKDAIFVELGGPEGTLSAQDIGVIPYLGGESLMSKESFVMDSDFENTDFSGHPITLGEARVGDWTTWTPREALVKTLREIDSGEVVIRSLAMVRELEQGEEEVGLDTRVASPDGIGAVIGLFELAKMHIYKRNGD